ncbi:MAG: hypothetical protein IPK04_20010 [Bdellovibrionales bacterium]|nr:hypothetical protein [Bdellovibrionales bacterium]
MKLFIISLLTILTSFSQAEDSGDKSCQVVLVRAQNVVTGGWGNYYEATVAVSKDLISKLSSDFKVKLVPHIEMAPVATSDTKNYTLFSFKFEYGAYVISSYLNLIALVQDGTNSIYDSNFGTGMVSLNKDNNWMFVQSKCPSLN